MSGKILKVWGGVKWLHHKQVRAIIATRTKKEACIKLDITMHRFNECWGETGNEIEIRTALAKEGVVFVASSLMDKNFVEAEQVKSYEAE